MSQDRSVSPLEPVGSDNDPVQRGDDLQSGVVQDGGGDVWDRAMQPFDQDLEEQQAEGNKNAGVEDSEEAARAKYIRPGYHPTSREVAEHMVNHLPYRAWCKRCIKGKAKGLARRKHDPQARKEDDARG